MYVFHTIWINGTPWVWLKRFESIQYFCCEYNKKIGFFIQIPYIHDLAVREQEMGKNHIVFETVALLLQQKHLSIHNNLELNRMLTECGVCVCLCSMKQKRFVAFFSFYYSLNDFQTIWRHLPQHSFIFHRETTQIKLRIYILWVA